MSYHISVCLGMHYVPATANANSENPRIVSKPLREVEPSQLRPQREAYKALWLGRILMLFALVLQFSGTFFLSVRRLYASMQHVRYQPSIRMWSIDTKNGLMALGGVGTAMKSIAISVLNLTWTDSIYQEQAAENVYEMTTAEDLPRSRSTMTEVAPVIVELTTEVTQTPNLAMSQSSGANDEVDDPLPRIVSRETNALASYGQKIILLPRQAFEPLTHWYLAFRSHSDRVSRFLLRFFPLELRRDFELAYLMMIMFFLLVVPQDGFWGTITREGIRYGSPKAISDRLADLFWRSRFGLICEREQFCFPMKLYLAPVMFIIIHYFLWSLDYPFITKWVPKTLKKFVSELEFWFGCSWTIFSLSLLFLMFFPLYFQFLFIIQDFEAIALAKGYWEDFGWDHSGVFWKDPLSDKLYII